MATRSKYPIAAVGAVVLTQNHVLMVRRINPPMAGSWSLPGGKIKYGESVYEALRRECLEETGVAVQPVAFLDIVEWMSEEHHYLLIDWLATSAGTSGDLPRCEAGSDAAEAHFFSVDEALQLPLWEETRRLIRKAANYES